MPIYEYQCQKCGHQLEVIQKISDAPLADCPECGESALKKLVSAAAFRLKGGGWYETDFKSGDKKKNLHGDGAKADAGGKSGSGDAAGGAKSGGETKSGGEKKPSGGEKSA